MYEVILKYAIQAPGCLQLGINPICAKCHTFPTIIKGVPFSQRASIIILTLALTNTQVPKYIGKATT